MGQHNILMIMSNGGNTSQVSNGVLTEAKDWMKVRGTAIITNGKRSIKREVHWYQCINIGKIEFKIKEWTKKNDNTTQI